MMKKMVLMLSLVVSLSNVFKKIVFQCLHATNGNCSFEMNKVVLTLTFDSDFDFGVL
jgi:hypothetical protein